MSVSERIPVFALVFGVGYAVIYVVCTEVNLPLITYHPVTGDIGLLRQPARTGPVMYWYGWMLTSLVGAVALAASRASFRRDGFSARSHSDASSRQLTFVFMLLRSSSTTVPR